MNAMPTDGAPGVFVLCRTGLKDLQVLPYEPVKWVQRLRGNQNPPAGKFLAYEKDEAHVYTIPRYYEARGHDLAILDLWAEGRLRQQVHSTGTRKNRKIRYTMAQQKRQQKQQDGGRRRRRATRKAHRKARRGTRRQQRK
jgi:hypothetical protein